MAFPCWKSPINMAYRSKAHVKARWLVLRAMSLSIPNGIPSSSPPSEDEEDMLDLAFGLTHTSRLGCQIMMSDMLDGLRVLLPAATRNMMVDKK